MKSTTLIAVPLVLLFAAGWWLVAAMNYGDDVASGSYNFRNGGAQAKLHLKADHTFEEELIRSGTTQTATGSWHRFGEGGLAFSKGFLTVPGQQLSPDGSAYGELHKILGLFPYITMTQYNVFWYGKTSTSVDLTGTYAGDDPRAPTTLVINPDHSFQHLVETKGGNNTGTGKWSIDAQGQLMLRGGFLNLSGLPLDPDEEAMVEQPQRGNLQVEVRRNSSFGVPTFHRKYFNF